MKVKCSHITLEGLPPMRYSKIQNVDEVKRIGHGEARITLGEEYLVYGVYAVGGNVWYYIVDDSRLPYPMPVMAVFFEVIDPRVSRHWEFRFDDDGGFRMWPRTWYRDYYHDLLTDGDPDIVADFEKTERILVEEFE